jgi:hypothetical protein
MKITKSQLAAALKDYLYNRMTLSELVRWAEDAMQEGEFNGDDKATRDIVARLGVADVKAFGLSWEDINAFLQKLGYTITIEIVPRSEAAG